MVTVVLSILHVAQPTDGGVASYVFRLAKEQACRGAEVSVACPPEGELARRLDQGGVPRLDWPATRNPGPGVPREVRSLRRILAATTPEVLHLHSAKAGLAGRLIRRRPITVFQPHGWSWEAVGPLTGGPVRVWERVAARRADAVVCVAEAEQAAGIRAGLRPNWALVVSGVDVEAFGRSGDVSASAARGAVGLADQPTVVCVGTLRPAAKGQDVLLAAWPAVLERFPEARLVLVGDGPGRSSLGRLAGPSVTFVGHQDDVGPWLAAADAVAVPSRREAMPLAMLEAMASGRAVVATDFPGARSTLGQGGAVVALDDPPALADGLVERLCDPGLAAREGQAGRRRVAEQHDFTRVVTEMEAVYCELRGRSAAGRPR